MNAARTARERARAELTAEITRSARDQLRDVGAAALSLRAVARDLGLASSAVYRYFPSRDALLTTLITEAYTALGDEVVAVVGGADARGLEGGRSRGQGLGTGAPARVRAALRLPRAGIPCAATDHRRGDQDLGHLRPRRGRGPG
ncbi:TetR/AcrR family transcriptional regulator [Tsukamurella sp. PLM1]|uniref:TetR/AcrR family transcriptional regulator n=1 Tax=Tsukamurella sp. PLM1 TaxID=2929795 RepID=UPI00205EA41F|nr:helix-turn-helix domain-containing protein [Tsukamurella sp. PLM1]BDH58007.1 hypothetical protein MTP03_29460 [Tsukamurella sp. PLM1]